MNVRTDDRGEISLLVAFLAGPFVLVYLVVTIGAPVDMDHVARYTAAILGTGFYAGILSTLFRER